MNNHLRACLAHVAACTITRTSKTSVYDYTQRRRIIISGRIDLERVQAFDHDRGVFLTGTLPTLYDHFRTAVYRLRQRKSFALLRSRRGKSNYDLRPRDRNPSPLHGLTKSRAHISMPSIIDLKAYLQGRS
jgi:hypothetical protein